MAPLRGACGVVSRPIRSFAVVLGATMRSAAIRSRVGREAAGAENRLLLAQFDAEELRSDVGLFRGVLVHEWSRTGITAFSVKGLGDVATQAGRAEVMKHRQLSTGCWPR
jgi:hypothetical protein